MSSGRRLIVGALLLFACDVIGGFIAVYTNLNTWSEAWGFDAKGTVPLPIGAVQLLLAWLAARNARPPVGFVAAIFLGVFCLISLLAGLFDGDLINNVRSDGLSLSVAWAIVLLALTAVVGVSRSPARGTSAA
jgi:hypothetical protein